MPDDRHQRIRQIYNILVEGDDIPPPLCKFEVGKNSSMIIDNSSLNVL